MYFNLVKEGWDCFVATERKKARKPSKNISRLREISFDIDSLFNFDLS